MCVCVEDEANRPSGGEEGVGEAEGGGEEPAAEDCAAVNETSSLNRKRKVLA